MNTMTEAKISIIVPVYNVEPYLAQCVDSILAQTHKNLEIILVDDGSTDNSGKICDIYAEKDDRIKVIHKVNGGISSARNAGLDCTTGDYIAFFDSDDYYLETAMEYLYAQIKQYNVPLVIAKEQNVSFDGKIIGNNYSGCETFHEEIITEEEFWKRRQYNARCVLPTTKLYRKELFDGVRFDEKCIRHEDQALLIKIIPQCKSILYSDYVIFFYRQREGSIIHSAFNRDNLAIAYAMEDEIEYFLEKRWEVLGVQAFGMGVRNLREGYYGIPKEEKEAHKEIRSLLAEYKNIAKTILKRTSNVKIKIKMYTFLHLNRLYMFISNVRAKK